MMFLSSTLEGMIREVNSRVVLKKIRKNGYEVIRIRPGHKTKNNHRSFKDFLYNAIKQQNLGGGK
jgi:predicted CoA-binding protein